MKKQLAEKERALLEEQEASLGLQNKLRDIRSELNSERSRLLQNIRNLEETLTVKQTELQSMIARNHTQNQKIQQVKPVFIFIHNDLKKFILDASSVE